MKYFTVLLVLGLAAFAACRPDDDIVNINVSLEDQDHEAEGDTEEWEGVYSWTSPEGLEFYIKYVADEDGYRVVESNAVPADGAGVRANGEQVSFASYEADSVEFDN
ncbi:larval cuticle protein 2-like [Oratosquilla oratoria]|uniref:larval cuticle protein 2-like n=1 Tax=Oratosquilla oratoria TaxID=337810 RepID=UPI003F76E1FB